MNEFDDKSFKLLFAVLVSIVISTIAGIISGAYSHRIDSLMMKECVSSDRDWVRVPNSGGAYECRKSTEENNVQDK